MISILQSLFLSLKQPIYIYKIYQPSNIDGWYRTII
nr:MAG TPA: hypothetical protein [Caudoviricetes sp.]